MRKFSQIVVDLTKKQWESAQNDQEFTNLSFYMTQEKEQEKDLSKAFSKGYMLGIPEVENQPYLETLVEVLIGTLADATRNLPKSDAQSQHRTKSTINRDMIFVLGHITDCLEYIINCSSFHSDVFHKYDRDEIARKMKWIAKL
jgi:hypothetical protein